MTESLTVPQGADLLDRVRRAVATRVVGQEATVSDALVAYLARGHVLIEGVPGTAKTLLVRSLASALGLRFARIQFTPDLMPSDVTGVNVLRDPARGFEFQPGPIFTDLLLGDEINRAPAKTQSALLEAMAERQVTVDGVSRGLGEAFTVFATQNPVEHEGTYPLPEAQLDRFLVKTVMPYPSREAELELLTRYENGFDAERLGDADLAPALRPEEVAALRRLVDGVRVTPEVRAYVADIARATREERMLALGASPRATVSLFRAARAAAVLEGRDFATPDDVKGIAPAVLRHRIVLAPELEVEGRTPDDVLAALLGRVRAPE
ncbi:MAG: MoxR family ATPase [Gemmatimonadaceae bacterium]|nr:MoxR family ATPase [Gemmatimonadaceae bacterium]NUO95123.1 MoxR family ATPase [Gemmatimonadaceae bacterium]NUP56877.1 MoxR family ATPase [Gemmatimonadaceae bacterium]NUP72284.1 MoxR family ATPase [Gemmatimonadaceae bacterium]NUS32214.1 MoxR family ATPase [Gemmatimonadaceae bacterium]